MRIVLALSFSIILLGSMPARGESITLNRLKCDFDPQSGAVLRMTHPAVGTILETSPDRAGLLQVTYPGRTLQPAGSRARWNKTADGLEISWASLGGESPGGGAVAATVTFRAASDGQSVILSCRVGNNGHAAISQVLFPDLQGLRPFDEPHAVELRMALGAVNPFAHPVRPEGRARYHPPFVWQRFPFAPVYQMHGLRWMDLGSLKGGLSIYQRKWLDEPVPSIVTRRLEADPRWMQLAWQEATAIPPGKTWESGEYWFTPHRGGWAKGIEPYRQYVQAMNPPRRMPRRIRDGVGFQTFWINTRSYKFIPKIVRDAKAHGIDEVCLWVWCEYGSIPVRHNPRLGTLEEFLAAVKQAKAEGVAITPFFNLKNLDNRLAARYGVQPGGGASWSFDGSPPTSQNPLAGESGQFDIDTRNAVWQRDVVAELRRWCDLGVTSFAWDVFHDYGSMGLTDTIRQVRQYAAQKNPEGAFCVEPYLANLERVAQVGDYTWNWLDYIEAGPYLNAVRYPRINCNVERDARVVKMALADGLFINAMPKQPDGSNGSKLIGEEPELSAAIRQAAALRRKFLPYFVDGIFLGESVLSRPACRFVRRKSDGEIGGALYNAGTFEYPEVFVRGHQLGEKLLVVVLNNGAAARPVEFRSDLSLWLPQRRAYRSVYYDGNGNRIRDETSRLDNGAEWRGQTNRLAPLELAFVEIEALP